jgi:hypothetical protein
MTSLMLCDGHACPLCLFLGILQHDDVLGDTIRLHVALVHVGAEGDHVDGVEPTTVGIEEGDDLEGRHLHVKGVGILEVVVPDLVDGLAKEFGSPLLGRLVTGVVIEAGLMGQFRADTNDCGAMLLS